MSKSEQSFWRRGFRIIGSSLACLAAVGLAASPAMASVEGEMNSSFNSSGAAANVTGPSAFDGQAAGY